MNGKSPRDLLDFSRRLQAATNFTELLSTASHEIRTQLGYQHAWLFIWEDDALETGRLLAVQSSKHDDVWAHAPVLHTSGDAMLEEIVRGQGAVVVADARSDPRTDKAIVEKLQNRTIVNVPLRLLDKPFGALGCGTFGDEGCRPPSPEEVDYLAQVATHLSIAAGRIRFAQEQKERAQLERKLAALARLEEVSALASAAGELADVLGSAQQAARRVGDEPLSARQHADLELALTALERAQQVLSLRFKRNC